jgi:hypothetical protein
MALGAVMLAPIAWTQTNQPRAKSLKGNQLIAWTQDQQARPMPETQTPATPAQDDVQKQPAAQAFTGMIMKSGDTYVLQTADNVTYQLDDQERAKQYEGKQVQVSGTLDKSANLIKVRDIKQTA